MDLISESIEAMNTLLSAKQYLREVLLAYILSFGWLTWKGST